MMRMSSPSFSAVTSVNWALYSVALARFTLAMVIASSDVARIVTTAKAISLSSGARTPFT